MTRVLLIVAVGLLALIWLEIGGADRLTGLLDGSVRAVRNIGKPEELPAPAPSGARGGGGGGGILNLHADDMARAAAWSASPPASSASR